MKYLLNLWLLLATTGCAVNHEEVRINARHRYQHIQKRHFQERKARKYKLAKGPIIGKSRRPSGNPCEE
jgi:hypothetical protein